MPQLFQVLKCFKCAVFQVHQVKKSNKLECKLCGEKQSIKRHYGLGTGKECRLHVQKLNSIKREVDEMNETTKLNENSDDEEPVKIDSNRPQHKKDEQHSKWLGFVDEKDNVVTAPEPNVAMFVGKTEDISEIPSKRRKFNRPKNTSISNITCKTKFKVRRSPSPPPIIIYESQEPNAQESKIKNNKNYFKHEKQNGPEGQGGNIFAPQNSKWAQYADESAGDDCEDYEISEVKLKNDDYPVKCENGNLLQNNLFSLCNENDLDDVLDL